MATNEKETKNKGVVNSIYQFFSGNFLTSESLQKFVPYAILFVILSVVYISNSYSTHYLSEQNRRLEAEIKQLRAEYVSTERILINKIKLINLQDEIKQRDLGLKESNTPAYTIKVNDER